MTFLKSGNRPPYIMFVLLTRVSISFSSLLESEFQELNNTPGRDDARSSMNKKIIFIRPAIIGRSED